jgi:hypothetical protein
MPYGSVRAASVGSVGQMSMRHPALWADQRAISWRDYARADFERSHLG